MPGETRETITVTCPGCQDRLTIIPGASDAARGLQSPVNEHKCSSLGTVFFLNMDQPGKECALSGAGDYNSAEKAEKRK